jgi:hypothetical protein
LVTAATRDVIIVAKEEVLAQRKEAEASMARVM